MNDSTGEKQEEILTEYYTGYQQLQLESAKSEVKKARNALFFVAGVSLLFTIVTMLTADTFEIETTVVLFVVTGIFAGLGLMTKKQPFVAIIIGLILYVGLWLVDIALAGTENIYKGLLVRCIIIYFLIKGLKHAREAERLMKELKSNG